MYLQNGKGHAGFPATETRIAMKILKHRWALFFILLTIPGRLLSASPLILTGYYKNFSVVFDPVEYRSLVPVPQEPLMGSVNNRLRLDLAYTPNGWISFQAAYDLSPRIQDPMLLESPPGIPAIDPGMYRASDLDSRLYPHEGESVGTFGIFQNLDRAVITVAVDLADVYIGRQAIAWGSAKVVNPTDVIAPFVFNELDTEDRIGVDALRVRIPLGMMGELDSGYLFGKDFEFENSALFLRSRFYVARTDVTVLLLGFRENLLLGLDLTRAAGGAGLWMETAYVLLDALEGDRAGSGEDYFRGTIGCDYSFSGKLYGFAEYHYNQAGTTKPQGYLGQLSDPAYTEGAVYLLGAHYLAPGFTLQATPLLVIETQALVNLADPSLLFAPAVEYNIAEDIYVSAGAFIGIGKRPELIGGGIAPPVRSFRSEFGGYPDIYFTSFRVYF